MTLPSKKAVFRTQPTYGQQPESAELHHSGTRLASAAVRTVMTGRTRVIAYTAHHPRVIPPTNQLLVTSKGGGGEVTPTPPPSDPPSLFPPSAQHPIPPPLPPLTSGFLYPLLGRRAALGSVVNSGGYERGHRRSLKC